MESTYPSLPTTPRVRRPIPLSLKLAALPPLDMGSPINEKDQLPCIMITPSSPTHEYDYQVLYFKPEPPCQGLFAKLRRSIWPSEASQVFLPESPRIPQYGYSTAVDAPNSSWTTGKRFRWILMLFACLFFLVHLFALPKAVDGGLYDVFSTHPGSNGMMDDAIANWEEFQPDAGVSANAKPKDIDAATPTAKIIKGDPIPTPKATPNAASWDDFVTASMI